MLLQAFFILQKKDLNMQKVSYIYSGETRTFYFNFPYFEKSNIVVTVDNKPAPAYNVIGNKGGSNPDFPFTSGRIVFVKPLKMFQTITIERHLPYNRPVDFQPTAPIIPTDLNLDMNNTMELLKDLKDEVDDLRNKYKDITDKEQIDILLEKIALFNIDIATFADKLTILERVPGMEEAISIINSAIESINATISEIVSSLNTIIGRTEGLLDYVIESQLPTAENNYTWYRKYKSGWVEQGGYVAGGGSGVLVSLIKPMSNTNYQINLTGFLHSGTAGNTASVSTDSGVVTTTHFYVNNYVENGSNKGTGVGFWWTVSGIAE